MKDDSILDERERFANIREKNGKPPKVELGTKTREEKNKLLLGCMVENIIGAIRLMEVAEGRNIMFDVSIPLKDGRTLAIDLRPTNMPSQHEK